MMITELEPNAYQFMYGLEKYVNSTELASSLWELIKIRASQINRCTYGVELLAVTEEVTLISSEELKQASYDAALKQLGNTGLAQCIMQMTVINAWNRIAASTLWAMSSCKRTMSSSKRTE